MKVYSGSGTSLLKTGWTLFQSGVSLYERRQAGVGVLYPLDFLPYMLGLFPVDEGVVSLCLPGKGPSSPELNKELTLRLIMAQFKSGLGYSSDVFMFNLVSDCKKLAFK